MLSDHVIREANTQKLSLIGIFSQWVAPALPFAAPPFFITTFIANWRVGGVNVPFAIRIELPDKHVIWSMGGQIGFAAALPLNVIVEIPVRVTGLTFPVAGRYIIRLIVDGDEIGQRDFLVSPITGPTAQQNPPA